MMSGIVLCSKRQMNCMEWIYMRRWWREKDFSSVFNEKIITSDIDADSIVEMIYIDSANEG